MINVILESNIIQSFSNIFIMRGVSSESLSGAVNTFGLAYGSHLRHGFSNSDGDYVQSLPLAPLCLVMLPVWDAQCLLH